VERACADGDVDRAIGSDLLLVHRVRPLVGVDMASDAQVHLVSVQQPWPEMNALIRCQLQAGWMGGQQKAPSIATLIFSASPWCAQLELYQGLGRQRSQVSVAPTARKGGWIVPMPAHHQPRGELPVYRFQICLEPSVEDWSPLLVSTSFFRS
jgi:hypothetical protein